MALALLAGAAQAAPTPRSVVEAMFAAVNRHDAAALGALYTDDAVITSSETCATMAGARRS